MYLARTKRLASRAQRLVLYSRDRGCTRPDCTAPPGQCQGHHGDGDWIDGGLTDVDTLTLGCGGDNRLVTNTDWHTSIRHDGRIQWHPPPLLDTGQDTVNHYFHPEDLLNPPENQDEENENGETGDGEDEEP